VLEFRGTPQQRQLEECRPAAATGGPEAQRILAYIEAQEAAGDTAARVLKQTIDEGAAGKRNEFRNRARASQVEGLWDVAYGAAPEGTTPGAPAPGGEVPSTPVRRYNPSTGGIE
jgi:hypothetical protein